MKGEEKYKLCCVAVDCDFLNSGHLDLGPRDANPITFTGNKRDKTRLC